MIETSKILTGKYDALVSPTLITPTLALCGFKKIDLNTIYGNTVSLTGLLTYGIVYQILLCLLTLLGLMYLRTDQISSTRFKRLFMILKHSYKEPEVEVE